MLVVTEEEVRQLLPMARAIELVESGFLHLAAGRARNHPRRRLHLDPSATLHYMCAVDLESGYLGAKLYTTHPETGFHFLVLLWTAVGRPLALFEANALGQIRTGAASGVATRLLARPEATVVGLIGAGFQARSQLEAVVHVRKIQEIRVFSRSEEARRRFAVEMSESLGVPVHPALSPEQCVRGCHIVVTATSSKDPVLRGEWLDPGAHVNAIGANHRLRRELDEAAVNRAARVVVDSIEQARIESGDLIYAFEKGAGAWGNVAELADLVAGRVPGRRGSEEITLFKSNGLAIEDVAVAGYLYEEITRTSGSAARYPATR